MTLLLAVPVIALLTVVTVLALELARLTFMVTSSEVLPVQSVQDNAALPLFPMISIVGVPRLLAEISRTSFDTLHELSTAPFSV